MVIEMLDKRDMRGAKTGGTDEMGAAKLKKCPYCAENIQFEAVKCRYCGEFLNKDAAGKSKWYHSTAAIITGLATLGPFALPLVWSNKRYSIIVKIVITIVVAALTVLLMQATVSMYSHLIQQINSLGM